MTYDLAVWEGTAPTTPEAAAAEYEARMDRADEAYDSPGGPPSPSPAILGFVEAALARFPELTMESGAECPWAMAPLIEGACGDLVDLNLTFDGAAFAVDVLAQIAREHDLVCYDPQLETVLAPPSAST